MKMLAMMYSTTEAGNVNARAYVGTDGCRKITQRYVFTGFIRWKIAGWLGRPRISCAFGSQPTSVNALYEAQFRGRIAGCSIHQEG